MTTTPETTSSIDPAYPSLIKPNRQRRAIRPCDLCRLRKSRCVSQLGYSSCTACRSRGTVCTYHEKPPPRPSRSQANRIRNGRTHSRAQSAYSSPAHRLLVPNVGVNRDGSTTHGALTSPHHLPTFPSSDRRILARRSLADACGLGLQDLRDDIPVKAPRCGKQKEDTSLGHAPSRFAELYGLTSDMEPILMRHRPYCPQTQEFRLETHGIRRVLHQDAGMEYPLTFHMVEDKKSIGYSEFRAECDAIENCVAPYGPRLVHIFWRIVHPCFPILYRRGFMDRYFVSYREVPGHLLGAVYLIALNWWTYDRELSNRPVPNATLLRDKVIVAIQQSYHRPKLSSIEATLILLQWKPEDALNPDHTWTWGYTGQALSIGQALGLHLDADSWEIPEWERRVRKRLSWALYMQDKWTALMHGRPSHIQDDNWDVQDLTCDDFSDLDDGDTESSSRNTPNSDIKIGRGRFIEMVHLTKILSEVLGTFFSLRASRDQDTVRLYRQAVPFLSKLHNWHEKLAPSLQPDMQSPRQLCANGFLHLAYHGLVLTLLRRIIRSTALAPLCSDVTVLNNTRKLASDSAKAATSFIRSLRPDHMEAFWYFASGFNFSLVGSFITLLLVTSRSESEKTHRRESLTDYLWILRIMGKASEPMRYAVNRLEGAILRGMEHALAVKTAPTVPGTAQTGQPELAGSSSIIAPQSDTMALSSPAISPVAAAADDWLTPFINEDSMNLDLGQFDWLGALR